MGEKLIIGPIDRGLRTDRTPFNIDNDSFPKLVNAYQWRGRVKRKRGTSKLGRLTRYFASLSTSYSSISTITLAAITGAGNFLSGAFAITTLSPNATIVPGSAIVTHVSTVYTDQGDGTFSPSGTINYATGAIAIVAEAGHAISATFLYYPELPAMGLRDLILQGRQFPGSLAFDTTYSYNISTASPYNIWDVSFYKNPPTSAYLINYVQKTVVTPTTWNGQNYQQFWTVNYQGALWATNGVNVPFSIANVGMQYASASTTPALTAATYVSPTSMTFTITGNPLVVGDFVFANEFTGSGTAGLNFQTGYVITAGNTFTVKFPYATIANATYTVGMLQYLTNRSSTTVDCLRWYDGDPTNGSATAPTLTGNLGWVNFAPPISEFAYVVSGLPQAQYYLVGAKMIVPFKNRLLFIGPVVQTSAAGSQVYLQDTVIYSQDGTPYYTASYTNEPSATVDTPTNPTIVFNALLVPSGQGATPCAYFEDQTGFGGFVATGLDMAINTPYPNRDVLIMGQDRWQSKLVFTGDDLDPFRFYTINSELGSGSTFSGIVMDEGVLTRGTRGFVITNETNANRFDLDILDQEFEIILLNNGSERICAQRDFINEWVYFTYLSDTSPYNFPNQTLQYNYRDKSWAIFNECYTTYGFFRPQTGFTWANIGTLYPTWEDWNEPWSAGTSELLQQQVIAGNQQGFIVIREKGTGETPSLAINAISGSTITCPNHCLDLNDFIVISGCIGTISQQVNGKTFQVSNITTDTFDVEPSLTSATYLGGGVITRLYIPEIITKQFPTSWNMGRKTRLGVQQYLFTTTPASQITLLIFLSQDSANAWNDSPIIPALNSVNDSLIYSTTLFTCPESTNLGLTPANINLNMVTAQNQAQTWHRMNTSLIGDTVQIGFTVSDELMTTFSPVGLPINITGATQANPCVLTIATQSSAPYGAGTLIQINGVSGMTQLNYVPTQNNLYNVITSDTTTVTIEVDSSAFGMYISGGTTTQVSYLNQTAEIEFHGAILDVSPSMWLA
jgi:hypothetical protein